MAQKLRLLFETYLTRCDCW